MSGSPAPNAGQPQLGRPVGDPMGHAPPVGQSKAPALLKSANPFVGCFPADRPAPTQLGQLVSLSQVLFNESPALNFVTTRFPRHICLESVTYAVRKKCNLCADNMPTPCAPSPASLGFSMPAEWERHEATWLAWPHNPT